MLEVLSIDFASAALELPYWEDSAGGREIARLFWHPWKCFSWVKGFSWVICHRIRTYVTNFRHIRRFQHCDDYFALLPLICDVILHNLYLPCFQPNFKVVGVKVRKFWCVIRRGFSHTSFSRRVTCLNAFIATVFILALCPEIFLLNIFYLEATTLGIYQVKRVNRNLTVNTTWIIFRTKPSNRIQTKLRKLRESLQLGSNWFSLFLGQMWGNIW